MTCAYNTCCYCACCFCPVQAWQPTLDAAKQYGTAFFHKYLAAETAAAAQYMVHPIIHGGDKVGGSWQFNVLVGWW